MKVLTLFYNICPSRPQSRHIYHGIATKEINYLSYYSEFIPFPAPFCLLINSSHPIMSGSIDICTNFNNNQD